MRRLIPFAIVIAAALAACGRGPTGGAFRDTAVPIYSNAVFQPARLAGEWVQVADFTQTATRACRPGAVEFAPAVAGTVGLTAQLCLSGTRQDYTGVAAIAGPGRLALRGADKASLGQTWWVLWVDDGYRTMAIGTPSGDFGFILNRTATLPADRLAAARDVLDWNGYDLRHLTLLSGQP
jgi:apolipoprotein D and lipocalin family protein